MSSSSGAGGAASYGFGVGLAGGTSTAVAQQGQGVAALLVMLAVLCFIFAYCCWGAPFCRALCRRHCCCRLEDGDSESGCPGSGTTSNPDQPILATPTIILLPHGRMLVVDGTIFTQFQAESSGLDLVELGESVMRAQRNPVAVTRHHQHQNSQGSIIEMDAETPSKDSMGSLGCFPPPTYESIYGKDERRDMPPSYSDILLHRLANLPFEIELQGYGRDSKEDVIEMRSLEDCHPVGQGLVYPGYSSHSLPRNPSLITNPLDSYYEELAGLCRGQRRRSAAAEMMERPRRTSCGARTDVEEYSDNNVDNRFRHPWSQNSKSQNDVMNSRNNVRSDSRRNEDSIENLPTENRVFTRPKRSEERMENESVTMYRESRISMDEQNWDFDNLDVRYTSEESETDGRFNGQNGESEEASAEEDPNNFKALADIRESRV
ncbi:PREDICTED: uncharacterized protein LOC105363048 [Ceratosolen solmsi marchali]|uniref:Uncharacterized protein LOC105363048 n=1 Tax=Ceratosolen solmsi marchali TaxID=326594 RepID=A0AAJ6YIY2_9HYME|nr:PREDICTED: uncharacterized protein LOC105363048 [Ceratosolen solmsi marchali]